MNEEERKNATQGLRFNKGKPRVELLDADALLGVADVLSYGAKKYADNNWKKGMPWSIVIGCLLRHTFDLMRGKDFDNCDEKCENRDADWCKFHSRLPTVDLIHCNAMFLGHYWRHQKNHDDRFKKENP